MKECPDCGSTSWNVLGFSCQHQLCPMALQADGEKLRQLSGEDHGPWELREALKAQVDVNRQLMTIASPCSREAAKNLRAKLAYNAEWLASWERRRS